MLVNVCVKGGCEKEVMWWWWRGVKKEGEERGWLIWKGVKKDLNGV